MNYLIDILDAVEQSGQRYTLATIIHVEGSSYLKEGTTMLMKENGDRIGMLSPGCLEEDLIMRSRKLNQHPETITYDLRKKDDFGWGQGIGCNGVMKVLLEPVIDRLRDELILLKAQLKQGNSILHIKYFSPTFTLEDYQFIPFNQPESRENDIGKLIRTEQGYYFSYLYTPPPVLIIFGAGEDAKPLVTLASDVGFHVILCDWRPGYCNEVTIPFADQYLVGSPKKLVETIPLSKNDFVVVMSHHFMKDQEFLNEIIKKNVQYIGVLGPKERTQALCNHDSLPDHIFSPVGQSIGAQGSSEIAVSIMAEIIQTFRQTNKRIMKDETK